jgi:hypothetical protein
MDDCNKKRIQIAYDLDPFTFAKQEISGRYLGGFLFQSFRS